MDIHDMMLAGVTPPPPPDSAEQDEGNGCLAEDDGSNPLGGLVAKLGTIKSAVVNVLDTIDRGCDELLDTPGDDARFRAS